MTLKSTKKLTIPKELYLKTEGRSSVKKDKQLVKYDLTRSDSRENCLYNCKKELRKLWLTVKVNWIDYRGRGLLGTHVHFYSIYTLNPFLSVGPFC